MSSQFWLTQYFWKTNILSNQYAIVTKKNLSIKRKDPSILHVSPNVEDGSAIHCINFKPAKRNPHESIKGLQVQPNALVAFDCICLKNPLSHCLAMFPVSLAISDHRLNSRLQKNCKSKAKLKYVSECRKFSYCYGLCSLYT